MEPAESDEEIIIGGKALKSLLSKVCNMYDARVKEVEDVAKLTKEIEELNIKLQTAADQREEAEDIALLSDTLSLLTDRVFEQTQLYYRSPHIESFYEYMDELDSDPPRIAALKSALINLEIDNNDFDEVVKFQREQNIFISTRIRQPERLVSAVSERAVGAACASIKAIVLKYKSLIISTRARSVFDLLK